MSSRFAPCPACARHVKEGDNTCPFCGRDVPIVQAPITRTAAGRLSRSALFAASAVSAALATTGCSSTSSPTDGGPEVAGDATQNEGGSAQPLYGAVVPPNDAGEAGGNGGFEGGSVQPLYGAVAPTDAGPERFDGSAIALYGGAPINHT